MTNPIEPLKEDELGKTYIPDVYIVSGGVAWYWDTKDDLVFASVITQDGQTYIEWDEPGEVDSRADECAIQHESDIKDLLHKVHEADDRFNQAVTAMQAKPVNWDM